MDKAGYSSGRTERHGARPGARLRRESTGSSGSHAIRHFALPIICAMGLSACARPQSRPPSELGLAGLPPEFSDLVKLAERGDVTALQFLARAYETGDSLGVDVPQARRLYQHVIDLNSDPAAMQRSAERLRALAPYADVRIQVRVIDGPLYAADRPHDDDPCQLILNAYANFIMPRPTGNCGFQAYRNDAGALFYTISYEDEQSAEPNYDGYDPTFSYRLSRHRPNCGSFEIYSFSGASPRPLVIVAGAVRREDPVIPTMTKPPPEPCPS